MGIFDSLGLGGGLDTSMLGNLLNNGTMGVGSGASSQLQNFVNGGIQDYQNPIGPTQPGMPGQMPGPTQPSGSFNGMPTNTVTPSAQNAVGQPGQQQPAGAGLLGQQLLQQAQPKQMAMPQMQMPQSQNLARQGQAAMPTGGLLSLLQQQRPQA